MKKSIKARVWIGVFLLLVAIRAAMLLGDHRAQVERDTKIHELDAETRSRYQLMRGTPLPEVVKGDEGFRSTLPTPKSSGTTLVQTETVTPTPTNAVLWATSVAKANVPFSGAIIAPKSCSESHPGSVSPETPSISRKEILYLISNIKTGAFSELMTLFETRYCTRIVPQLIEIAFDRKNSSNNSRYIALMAALKIGGGAVLPRITPLLHDKNPFIRYGLVIGYRFLNLSDPIEPLYLALDDKALIVREAAVSTLVELHPTRAIHVSEFVKIFKNRGNYSGHKPLAILAKALTFLKKSADPTLVSSFCKATLLKTDMESGKKVTHAPESGSVQGHGETDPECLLLNEAQLR